MDDDEGDDDEDDHRFYVAGSSAAHPAKIKYFILHVKPLLGPIPRMNGLHTPNLFDVKWSTLIEGDQCDQKKLPNVYKKLPKNDFIRKIKDFDTFTKIA